MARMARKMKTNRVLFTSLGILTVLGLLCAQHFFETADSAKRGG
jgi:hypothetical protein